MSYGKLYTKFCSYKNINPSWDESIGSYAIFTSNCLKKYGLEWEQVADRMFDSQLKEIAETGRGLHLGYFDSERRTSIV